jgi:hypothetical protein
METEQKQELKPYHIVLIVISCLIALITIYLIALYIKSESFKTYSCFNIMLMSIVLFLDCLMLIISEVCEEKIDKVGKFIFLLINTFLDKMILSVLSLQVIIVYSGIIHTDFYFSHEKSFVKIGDSICVIVSITLAVVYSLLLSIKEGKIKDFKDGKNLSEEDFNIFQTRNLAKKILETIFCGINLFVNVFFLVIVIMHISRKRKEAKVGLIQDLGYGNQLLRFSLIFTVNIIAIIFAGIVVNFSENFFPKKKQFDDYCVIIFLIICFLIQLCFMINKTVYKETLKIFCKKKYREIDDDETKIKSISTFDIAILDDDDDDDN